MASCLDFLSTPIVGLFTIQRRPFEDERGSFTRLFCAEELREIGLTKPVVQINYSINRQKGLVRGLHFQHSPFAESKIVSCLKGKVLDVAVDLRQGSETFLHWHGEVLSEKNCKAFFIPEGFAHGFQTLEDESDLLYLHTELYSHENEGAINALDPRLNIDWPIPIIGLSQRDKSHPFVDDNFSGMSA